LLKFEKAEQGKMTGSPAGGAPGFSGKVAVYRPIGEQPCIPVALSRNFPGLRRPALRDKLRIATI
jgi:hypothetical protein